MKNDLLKVLQEESLTLNIGAEVRIVKELKFRKISEYNIKTALKEFSEEDYFEKLEFIASKKLISITETNTYKKRKKLADYLLYRGWESYLVYETTKALIP